MVSLKSKVSASAEGDDPTKVSESVATPAKMPLGVITTSRWAVAESSDEGEDEGEYYEEDAEYYSEEMENNYPDTASDEPDDPWKHFK
jgi:hypothetical protein